MQQKRVGVALIFTLLVFMLTDLSFAADPISNPFEPLRNLVKGSGVDHIFSEAFAQGVVNGNAGDIAVARFILGLILFIAIYTGVQLLFKEKAGKRSIIVLALAFTILSSALIPKSVIIAIYATYAGIASFLFFGLPLLLLFYLSNHISNAVKSERAQHAVKAFVTLLMIVVMLSFDYAFRTDTQTTAFFRFISNNDWVALATGVLTLFFFYHFISAIIGRSLGSGSGSGNSGGSGSGSGSGGGSGGSGSTNGSSGPDSAQIISEITKLRGEMKTRLDTQDATLGRIEGGMSDIRSLVQDILANLPNMKEFFDSWKTYFANLSTQITDLGKFVEQQKTILETQINTINTEWRAKFQECKSRVEEIFTILDAKLQDALVKLESVDKGIGELKSEQAAIIGRANILQGLLESVMKRINALPGDTATEIKIAFKAELDAIKAEFGPIKVQLGALDQILARLLSVEETIKKMKTPGIKGILTRISSMKKELVTHITDLDTKVSTLIKDAAGTDGAAVLKDVTLINSTVSIIQGDHNQASQTCAAIEGEVRPVLNAILAGEEAAAQLREALKSSGPAIESTEQKVGKLAEKINKAEEDIRISIAQRKAEQVALLKDVQQTIGQEQVFLTKTMNDIQTFLNGIAGLDVMRGRTNPAQWTLIIQKLIQDYKTGDQDIQIDIDQIKQAYQKIVAQRARLDAYDSKLFTPAETKRVTQVKATLTKLINIEMDQTRGMLRFFETFKASLAAQAAQFIDTNKDKKLINGAAIYAALEKFVQPFKTLIAQLQVAQAELLAEERETVSAKE